MGGVVCVLGTQSPILTCAQVASRALVPECNDEEMKSMCSLAFTAIPYTWFLG